VTSVYITVGVPNIARDVCKTSHKLYLPFTRQGAIEKDLRHPTGGIGGSSFQQQQNISPHHIVP
jgi:hypothetical protein